MPEASSRMGTASASTPAAPLPVTTLLRRAAMARLIKAAGRPRGKQERHGRRGSPEYMVWMDMKRRCYQPHRKEYVFYGARGIVMCDSWKSSFVAFFEDMGERPSPKHQIDRVDVNGNYCKENCRWATPMENSNNKRNNVILTLNGRSMTISQWAREMNVFKMTLVKRKNRGWTDEEILTKPLKNVGRTWSGKHQ